MGYPMDLDEYSHERIEQEYFRRLECLSNNQCYYCGRDLDGGQACKINEHNGEDE